MTPFGELPQWMDLGPDQDIAGPTSNIVELLKKKMRPKPGGKDDLLAGDSEALGKVAAQPEGVNSL